MTQADQETHPSRGHCVCVLGEWGGGALQLRYDMGRDPGAQQPWMGEVSPKASPWRRGHLERVVVTIAILGPRAVSGVCITLLPVAAGGGVGIETTL